jgi:hypothetical protein
MKKYNISHVKLTPEILVKAKEIKKESEKLNKEFGISVSKNHYALDVWLRLTPVERGYIMQQIEQPKGIRIYQDRCIRAIAQYL